MHINLPKACVKKKIQVYFEITSESGSIQTNLIAKGISLLLMLRRYRKNDRKIKMQ